MEKNKLFFKTFFLLAFLGAINTNAQQKYWVKFKDKNGTPFTIGNPSAYLSNQAIQRRATYNITIDTYDLPCTPSYINQVDNVSGVTILYASKWINGVVISATSSVALNTINTFSFVLGSNPVNRLKINLPDVFTFEESTASNLRTVSTSSTYYGGSYWQTKQLNLKCLHDQGYKGQGMVIGVMDSGFDNVQNNNVFDSLRNRGGIIGTRDFVTGGNSVYEDDAHGAMVLSCMAAVKPNVIYGSAPLANYWLFRTEDVSTETISEEYNWIRAAEFADSIGIDVLTTSLGYTTFDNGLNNHTQLQLDGKTAPMSIAANIAARKGMLVLNSAGNGNGSSWPKIGIPADADSICAVGAIDSLSNVTSFSSIGPTSDGRIKPELVARGSRAFVSNPNSSVGYANGTSFSCPILAGAMACFWQAHKSYDNIKVLDTLKFTASHSLTPNNSRGWGTPDMCKIPPINSPVKINENTTSFDNIIISPNPSNGFFNIQSSSKLIVIEVFSVTGNSILIKSNPFKLASMNFDISFAPAGVYFVRILTNSGIVNKKIIKQ